MARPLRPEERDVIVALLKASPSRERLAKGLGTAVVEDMNDGGMGSITFVYPDGRRHMSFELAEASYTDEDGVLVSIALNLDNSGDLFELDFWKVNFDPLLRYPRPSELVIKARASG
jgi:hypothetical protein